MAKGYVGVRVLYTPIEYIGSSGTQYIDTETKVHSNYKIELEISNFPSTTGSSWRGVCGSRTSNGAYDRYYLQLTNSNYFTFAYGSSDGNFPSGINLMNKTLISIDKNVAKIGNTSATASTTTFTSAYTYYLFALNNANSAADKCSYRLHSFKIYDSNNILVKDFIPVLDTANIACLYEKIESKFYYNKGTGTFAAGSATGSPVVIGDKARRILKAHVGVPTSYTPVEYIESTGTQYIDTRFKHNQNTRMVADLSFSDISSWSYPFGSFGGSSGTNKLFCAEIDNESHLGSYFGTAQRTSITASGRHSFDLNKNVHKIDNSTYTFSAVTMQSEYNDLIFGATGYDGNATLPRTKIKLYSFKLYDNGTLIRDFIPVIDQDNAACLYDLVEGNFYYNKGTGAFTAGNIAGSSVVTEDKARKIAKGYAGVDGVARQIFAKYISLNYIESDGSQWIDTGVVYDYATTQFDIDFQYLSSDSAGYISVSWSGSNHDAYVLGSSGTSSSGSIICATAQVDSWTTIATKDANRHKYTYNNSSHQIVYDGRVISGRTTVNVNGVVSMRIFRAPGSNNPAKARIYGYKISNIATQELIRDFIPVLDDSGVPCLYDKVSDTFFYNKGTGTFLYN